MNLVGKIFVVLIFVMSLVFMSFAMAVYSTHKNWREIVLNEQAGPGKPLGLVHQLKNEQARNKELSDQLEKAKQQIEFEKNARIQALTKLENELEQERKDRRALEAGYAAEKKDTRDAIAAMSATQKNATDYRQELEKLRTAVVEAQQDRDAHFKEVVRLTDELHQTVNEKELLRKRMEDLSKDLAKAREALRYFDINENSDYKSKTPPRVEGVVLSVAGDGLIEISIGSDMGLRKGHQLQVYRIDRGENAYVGRIEVLRTTADRAVCKIDPRFQNSPVMKGDRVASKLD